MHYRPTAFAKPGTVTLVAIKPNITFGQAKVLSPLDIAKANALYKCGMLKLQLETRLYRLQIKDTHCMH